AVAIVARAVPITGAVVAGAVVVPAIVGPSVVGPVPVVPGPVVRPVIIPGPVVIRPAVIVRPVLTGGEGLHRRPSDVPRDVGEVGEPGVLDVWTHPRQHDAGGLLTDSLHGLGDGDGFPDGHRERRRGERPLRLPA